MKNITASVVLSIVEHATAYWRRLLNKEEALEELRQEHNQTLLEVDELKDEMEDLKEDYSVSNTHNLALINELRERIKALSQQDSSPEPSGWKQERMRMQQQLHAYSDQSQQITNLQEKNNNQADHIISQQRYQDQQRLHIENLVKQLAVLKDDIHHLEEQLRKVGHVPYTAQI